MFNKKEKQHYTKQDIDFFNMLSNFKENYNEYEINFIENDNKVEEKYTANDYNNFNHIIRNHDTDIVGYISNQNSKKQKDSGYSKDDLKNFRKLDTQVYAYEVSSENFKDKMNSTKINSINYEKNDLENFNQIIKNQETYESNSVKVVNVYEHKNSKLKKENLNLKKIKILYFD